MVCVCVLGARVGWQRLVMSSIYMDSIYKKQLAVILANNYSTIMRNFLEDSHEHDVSVSKACPCQTIIHTYTYVRSCQNKGAKWYVLIIMTYQCCFRFPINFFHDLQGANMTVQLFTVQSLVSINVVLLYIFVIAECIRLWSCVLCAL